MRVSTLFGLSLAALLTIAGTQAIAAPTASQKCAAAKQKCVAKAFSSQMNCWIKATLTGTTLDADCQTKNYDKTQTCFAKATAAAEGACNETHANALHLLDDDILVWAEDIAVNDLAP